MKTLPGKGSAALITGASRGLGEAFADQLAQRGSDLVLVARSKEKLKAIAQRIEEKHKVKVTIISADLSSSVATDQVIREVKNMNIRVDLLINNAGIGIFERFIDTPLPRQMEQIDLNIRALVALTHAFAGDMVSNRRGGVINIASTAGFQPLAGANIYAASKSFVILFSDALAEERAKQGVHVLAACPGPIATSFYADKNPLMAPGEMDNANSIASEVLSAFEKGKNRVIPGKLTNRLSVFAIKLAPRALVSRVAASFVRKLNHT